MNAWFAYAKRLRVFDAHCLVKPFLFKNRTLGFIVIHRQNGDIPSFGATRVFPYPSLENALRDALMLSKTMSHKCAILGYPYGGAKAVLIDSPMFRTHKEEVLKTCAEFLNSLKGAFITGADMGVSPEDVRYLARFTPHTVGLRVDPAQYTALGLIEAMKACSRFLFGSERLLLRSFAIQGLGKVGESLLKLLSETGARIVFSEKDGRVLSEMKIKYPNTSIAQGNKIYRIPKDVFCPCGEGGTITVQTAKILNCKAIVGGANNQIKSKEVLSILYGHGIVYCPDFLVNSGGLVSVIAEYELKEKVNEMLVSERIGRIGDILSELFTISRSTNQSLDSIARSRASE